MSQNEPEIAKVSNYINAKLLVKGVYDLSHVVRNQFLFIEVKQCRALQVLDR